MRKKVFFAGKATKGAVGGLGLIFILEAAFIPLGFDRIKSYIRLRFVIENIFIHLDFIN